MRVEEEYSYRHNGLSSFGGASTAATIICSQGNRNTHALMTNFIYDFTVGWPVSPHIGFGVGAVDIIDSVTLNPFTTSPGTSLAFRSPGNTPNGPVAAFIGPNAPLGGTLLKGNGWVFGYQAIAGIRYDINPLLAFDLDYRYLATTDPTFTNKGQFPFPGRPERLPAGLTKYKTGYKRRTSSPA